MISRRSLLKAAGIGAAVSVSGVAIAKEKKGWTANGDQKFTDTGKGVLSYSGEISAVFDTWQPSAEYHAGEIQTIKGSDGQMYQAVAENGGYTLRRYL